MNGGTSGDAKDRVSISLQIDRSLLLQSLQAQQNDDFQLMLVDSLMTQCFGSLCFSLQTPPPPETSSLHSPSTDVLDASAAGSSAAESPKTSKSSRKRPRKRNPSRAAFFNHASFVEYSQAFDNHSGGDSAISDSQEVVEIVKPEPEVEIPKPEQDRSYFSEEFNPLLFGETEDNLSSFSIEPQQHSNSELVVDLENSSSNELAPDDFYMVDADGSVKFNQHELKKTLSGQYECPMCGKEYPANWNVIRHFIAIHTRLRYQCEICGSRVNEKSNFQSHLQRKHGLSSDSARLLVNKTRLTHCT